MTVLYVGNFSSEWTTEQDIRKAFEYLGHTVIQYQENVLDLKKIYAYDYDLLLTTGTWTGIIPLESWLDIIHECAVRGIPTATVHLDTFWSTVRKGRKWWRENMFHTAYIFTADGDHQKEWELFGKNHIWLPPAIRHDAAHFGKFREEYACDVAFVGSNGHGYHEDVWHYRKQLLAELRVRCRKNGWSFKNPGGDMPKIDRGEDMNDFYASAKVTVGDSLCLKKANSKYWSDRVPEATGRGGYLIMPRIDALSVAFPLVPQYDWGDFGQLEEMIQAALEQEEARIDAVEEQQTITKLHSTYVNRVQTILETVGVE